jgi:intraflagellar transport protein 172
LKFCFYLFDQVLESVDIEMARPHLRKIATHYSETRNFRMAERYYLQGGMATEVVKMYLTNSLWDEARKCADRALTVEQSSMLYEQQAAAMEAAGKFAEAERLYLEVNEPDLAINMYKKQRMFDRMLTLVGKWRKELLNDTHLHLARQFESENDFKMAEQHFVAAKDWKSAVQLYREHQLWDDALRVAKAHGGLGAYKQVAYASAVSLGGEAGIKMLAKRGLAELAIEYAIERGEFPEAFHIAEQAARQKLPEVHLQYAMSLEDAGRFDKAEEEFLMAGKPKEAVDMYIHQHEWQNALRVATQHDPSAVPSIREAQARDAMERKDFHTAEQHFAGAQKLELAVDMYKNAGMWDDAIRVARQAAPHAVHELQSEHAQYMATVAPNQPELVLNQVKQMLKVGQSHEAIDALLRITTQHSDNLDFLLRAWEQAIQIALEHQPARALEVVSIVARRMSELGRHDSAAQAWVAVEDYRQAVDSYLAAGNFAKARTLAQTSAPHLLDGVERAAQRAGQANSAPGYGFGSIGSGSMSAPAPMVSSANTEASLETLAARGDFERVFELCAQSNVETSMVQRFAIMHAAKLVQEEKYAPALQTLVQHGAPAVAVNVPIFRRVTQEILAHTGDTGSESQLRELLYKLVTAFKESSSIPPTVTKEFERYLLIAHSLAMKAQHKRLGLLQLHARACMSLLRFTTDVAVDQAFHDAGQACREVGWHSNAFVYFNRFVDLCDLIDNPESGDIENADFAGTDIPSPFDVPLPAKPAYDAASREEIREWVVDQAISNEANAQALSTRPCEKCSKQVAEATITCPHCKHEHTPCIVTGFPVPKSSKVACKACKLFASKDDWNTFVVKTKVCSWCGTQANAVY